MALASKPCCISKVRVLGLKTLLWESINRLLSFLVVFKRKCRTDIFFSKLSRYIMFYLLLKTETLKAFYL